MSPTTTIVLVLILSLTFDGALMQVDTTFSLVVPAPGSDTKVPLSKSSTTFTTTGFDKTEGFTSNVTETHLVMFTHDNDTDAYPAYIEVEVSKTDMLGRNPTNYQCLHDSLAFYEGNSTDGPSPLLVEVCGTETPTFDSRGPEVFVVFKTNETHQKAYKGATMKFTLVYGKIPPLKAKRQQLETFVFPSFGYRSVPGDRDVSPTAPPPPIRRTITIEASNETDIVAAFVNTTHMPRDDRPTTKNNCTNSKVIFYDGDNQYAAVLATVCGTDTPTIRSTGRFMTVYFEARSLQDEPWRGMTFSYQAEPPPKDDSPNGGTKPGIVNAFVVIVALITSGIVY